LLGEPGQRAARDERHGAAAIAAVDGMLLCPQQPERCARELRDRVLPRADHVPRRERVADRLLVDTIAELDDALDARPVREREREPPRLLVPLRRDAHQRAVTLAV